MLLVKTRKSPAILMEIDSTHRAYHRITQRLTRIGSDPRSTLHLPESIAERNLAMLEWDGVVVRIHNRSGYKFRLGETIIAPNASAEWPDRQVLTINDRLNMLLALDPARPTAGVSLAEDTIRLDDVQEPADAAPFKTWLLAGILFVLLAISVTMQPGKDGDAMAKALEPLVVAADEPGPNRAVRREIVARLQMAERQRQRTGKDDLQTWAELWDFVKTMETKSGRLPDRWFEDLRTLVQNRLASQT